jgi:hypothetical protein
LKKIVIEKQKAIPLTSQGAGRRQRVKCKYKIKNGLIEDVEELIDT